MLRTLPRIDRWLRRHGVEELAEVDPAVLAQCWEAFRQRSGQPSATVRALGQYLSSQGLDARAGVEQGRQQGVITPPVRGGAIDGAENGLEFVILQIFDRPLAGGSLRPGDSHHDKQQPPSSAPGVQIGCSVGWNVRIAGMPDVSRKRRRSAQAYGASCLPRPGEPLRLRSCPARIPPAVRPCPGRGQGAPRRP